MANRFAGGIKAGSTSVSIPVILRKVSDNTEHTGAVADDVTASFWRAGGARTEIAVVDLGLITDSWTSGGWKEVSNTTMPGVYRLDLPDLAVSNAFGDDWSVISVKVAGTYLFVERYATETQGASECYSVLNHTDFGLSKLVRSTTPANKLDVSAGRADADVKLWLGATPLTLAGQLVQTQVNTHNSAALVELATSIAAEIDEAIPELTAAPSATPGMRQALMLAYMNLRNTLTASTAEQKIRNDAGTVIAKATLTDDGTTFTRQKLVNGP